MALVGRDFKDHLIPDPLPQTGLQTARSNTRSGGPDCHLAWTQLTPAMGHPQLLRAACTLIAFSVKNIINVICSGQ